VCRRVAGNDADAADGCQEALMAIVRGLPRFDGRSSFKTWSYRVATNACLDEIRRRKRRPIAVMETPEPVSDAPGMDQRLADQMVLDEAMEQISEEFRLPVVLRDIGGLDYANPFNSAWNGAFSHRTGPKTALGNSREPERPRQTS
jgi:RNA polymerase sigma-70 factor (ECF subfamily)